MEHITDAWFVNRRTKGDWVEIGVLAGDRTQYGTISNAALAELAIHAGSTNPVAMQVALLQAVRAFARRNKYAIVPNLVAPLDL
jgi:hypothetical protein